MGQGAITIKTKKDEKIELPIDDEIKSGLEARKAIYLMMEKKRCKSYHFY